MHQVNIAVKSSYKVMSICHQKKIKNFRENQKKGYENNKPSLMNHMVYVPFDVHFNRRRNNWISIRFTTSYPVNINKNAYLHNLNNFFTTF